MSQIENLSKTEKAYPQVENATENATENTSHPISDSTKKEVMAVLSNENSKENMESRLDQLQESASNHLTDLFIQRNMDIQNSEEVSRYYEKINFPRQIIKLYVEEFIQNIREYFDDNNYDISKFFSFLLKNESTNLDLPVLEISINYNSPFGISLNGKSFSLPESKGSNMTNLIAKLISPLSKIAVLQLNLNKAKTEISKDYGLVSVKINDKKKELLLDEIISGQAWSSFDESRQDGVWISHELKQLIKGEELMAFMKAIEYRVFSKEMSPVVYPSRWERLAFIKDSPEKILRDASLPPLSDSESIFYSAYLSELSKIDKSILEESTDDSELQTELTRISQLAVVQENSILKQKLAEMEAQQRELLAENKRLKSEKAKQDERASTQEELITQLREELANIQKRLETDSRLFSQAKDDRREVIKGHDRIHTLLEKIEAKNTGLIGVKKEISNEIREILSSLKTGNSFSDRKKTITEATASLEKLLEDLDQKLSKHIEIRYSF